MGQVDRWRSVRSTGRLSAFNANGVAEHESAVLYLEAPQRAELLLRLAARAARTAEPPCSELPPCGGPQRSVLRPLSQG